MQRSDGQVYSDRIRAHTKPWKNANGAAYGRLYSDHTVKQFRSSHFRETTSCLSLTAIISFMITTATKWRGTEIGSHYACPCIRACSHSHRETKRWIAPLKIYTQVSFLRSNTERNMRRQAEEDISGQMTSESLGINCREKGSSLPGEWQQEFSSHSIICLKYHIRLLVTVSFELNFLTPPGHSPCSIAKGRGGDLKYHLASYKK